MKTFFCKLIPPRPTFAQDMSEAERRVMLDHVQYWRRKMEWGQVVTFGVVDDPAGPYGIGIVEVESEHDLRSFTENDPAIRSGRGFRFETFPMPQGAMHPPAGIRS